MVLKPGSVNDFAGSMAEAIEQAFQSEWATVKAETLMPAGEEDRKILFAAIARGVVKHLKEKVNEAFQIDVRVTQTTEVLMKSDNPAPISVSGGGGGTIAAHQAVVKQLENGNLIISEGEATHVEILTDE